MFTFSIFCVSSCGRDLLCSECNFAVVFVFVILASLKNANVTIVLKLTISQTSKYTQTNINNNYVSNYVHYTCYKSCQQHYDHYLEVCWVKWVAILTTPGINVVFEVEPVAYNLHSIYSRRYCSLVTAKWVLRKLL